MGSKGWLLETKLENRTDTLNIWLRVFGAGLDEGLVVEERVDACRGAKVACDINVLCVCVCTALAW